MNKKKLSVIVGGFFLIVGGFFYLKNTFYNKNADLKLYGNVDIRDVVLGFRVFGRVQHLHVDEGDVVKEGDVLASLDKEPFEKDLALKKAQLAQAKASLVNAEREYKRQKALFEKKVNAQKDYDIAYANFQEAAASEQAAQASVEQSAISLKDTDLIAPDNGTIMTRVREAGSVVTQGASIYTLSLDNPVWVRTYVDEPNLGKVYSGQKVFVSTDAGDTYEGQVGFISPQAEFTPKTVETTELRTSLVYRLRVIVNKPNIKLRQGMPVTINVPALLEK